jgi:PTS system cellobiose-specific IIC component
VVTQLVCILASILIYLPFVKIASRRAEQAQLQAESTEMAKNA